MNTILNYIRKRLRDFLLSPPPEDKAEREYVAKCQESLGTRRFVNGEWEEWPAIIEESQRRVVAQ
jgi:hypothetical protein